MPRCADELSIIPQAKGITVQVMDGADKLSIILQAGQEEARSAAGGRSSAA